VRELFERTNEPQFRAPARVSPEPTASTAALA
jgi:hypothetical protein